MTESCLFLKNKEVTSIYEDLDGQYIEISSPHYFLAVFLFSREGVTSH